MTTHRLFLFMLLAAAAGCSGDAVGSSSTAQAKSIADVPSPSRNETAGCGSVTATLYGHLGSAGWVGNALVSFDGGAPEPATFLDANTGLDTNAFAAGRPFRGTEVLTLTFSNGDQFAEEDRFLGVTVSTPDLYELQATGTIKSGTGRFTNASGHLAFAGPFLNPAAVETPPWIGTMTGSICM